MKKIRDNFLVNHHLSWATLRRLKTKFSIPWCCAGRDRPRGAQGGPAPRPQKKNFRPPCPKIKKKILFYWLYFFIFRVAPLFQKLKSHSLLISLAQLQTTQLKNLTKTKL